MSKKPTSSSATRQTASTVTALVKVNGSNNRTKPLSAKVQLSNRYDALKDQVE
ncbi:hypothetical protein Bca4012_085087 [Brassica carinata]